MGVRCKVVTASTTTTYSLYSTQTITGELGHCGDSTMYYKCYIMDLTSAPPRTPPPAPAQGPPPPPAQAPPAQPLPAASGPVPRPQAPPWGRWLDRDTNGCLNLQRIGESRQRPIELCSYKGLMSLPPVGKEYQQGYKLVNDRPPKVKQRLHRAAEYRRGIDGRARNNA
ncbi:hypothetical protein QJQ45_011262 [Haematococcus lacustris]|nr:hypothetical protein QJQ45_011262 [Haematococcus lacustris]